MLIRILASGAIVLFDVSASLAQEMTEPYRANYVRDACQTLIINTRHTESGRAGMEGLCAGVIGTVMRLGPMMNEQLRFCPPPDGTPTEVISIVLKYLDDTPAAGSKDIRDVAIYVGRKTWPCK